MVDFLKFVTIAICVTLCIKFICEVWIAKYTYSGSEKKKDTKNKSDW